MKRHWSLYAVPNPHYSDEQFRRFHHLDIAGMNDFELWRERRKVECAIAFWPRRDERSIYWLLERLAALNQECARRREDLAHGV